MRNKRCANCGVWNPYVAFTEDEEDTLPLEECYGECRKRSPRPTLKETDDVSYRSRLEPYWPILKGAQWCGEWETVTG